MKKTLIALAAVAATGAAFAQSTVTLSGGLAYGYQAKTTAGAKTSGFGMDTAAVKFAVTEDLGGGLKASGSMVAAGLARGNAVAGEDMTLGLSGGFGAVLMGQIEIGSGIRGLAQAGAPVNNMEGEVLGGAVNSDIVKYTAPKMGDFTFSGSLTEGATATGAVNGLANGLSAGQSRATTVGVDYAAGPLSAKLDMSSWKNSANDSRYRMAAQYDLGMAKVGAGFESTKLVAGGSVKYTMLGVSAPVGPALTVGAVWTKKDTAAVGTQTGSSFGASYALSKRTSVSANYASWETSEAAGVAKDKKTTILVGHSF